MSAAAATRVSPASKAKTASRSKPGSKTKAAPAKGKATTKASPGRRKSPSPRGVKAAEAAAREALVADALRARRMAHAPYSKFKVGAALRAASGRVYTGCNVENSSYGLSICAERVAMTKAVSEGDTDFSAIAVVTNSSPPSPPCGACRQVLAEFAPALLVILGNTDGERRELTLSELLPHAFDKTYL